MMSHQIFENSYKTQTRQLPLRRRFCLERFFFSTFFGMLVVRIWNTFSPQTDVLNLSGIWFPRAGP